MMTIPVINIESLLHDDEDAILATSNEIVCACIECGFFYIGGHGVPDRLIDELEAVSQEFFVLDKETKNAIAMHHGGKAWRGYFNVGDEFTSGIPDQKEGIYFGKDLRSSDTRPLHGKNLYLENSLGERMKLLVDEYTSKLTFLGKVLMKAIGRGLGIANCEQFNRQFSEDPMTLFRIFNYPPHNAIFGEDSFAVGEHTDYGYITILKQDDSGGLQVKNDENSWMDAPPIPHTFVINLGDALEHNTGGLLKATPHRVVKREGATRNRLSFPFFFDPQFDIPMMSVVSLLSLDHQRKVESNSTRKKQARWDNMDPTLFVGNYGSYLMKKVAPVFPDLATEQSIS